MTRMKLPKAFKKKWVAALRSGNFKQGNGWLYDALTDSYCCLGVACAVSGIPKDSLLNRGYIRKELIVESDKVPASLHHPSTFLTHKERINSLSIKLSEFNDKGKSFKWIAAYIERYL